MKQFQNRRIYRDDFELLHEGGQRMAKAFNWEVIDRPTEPTDDDPSIVTLESLGLERMRPVPPELVQEERILCETCINRHNPPGSGPCGSCDLTTDGEASNYCAESDPAFEGLESDDEDDEDDEDETEGPQTLGRL